MIRYKKVCGVQVDLRVFTAKFCCDYEKCKGACCNEPIQGVELNGGGLSEREAAEILFHRDEIAALCVESDRPIVHNQPVSKDNGEFFTTLIKDRCVLCDMNKGCVLKIANKSIPDIDIPISCQLYPIVWETTDKSEVLKIEDTFDEYCQWGYKKGEADNVSIIDFLKVPLIRSFGEQFFYKLKTIQRTITNGNK